MDIASLLGHHLRPLDLGDAAVGVEHADAHPGHIPEPHQSRLARIAGGCRQNADLFRDALLLFRGGQQLRQHAQCHILKGGRGPPEQLQHLKISDRDRRRQIFRLEFSCIGVFHQSVHIGNVRQQGLQNFRGHLLGGKRQAALPVKGWNGLRHIQPAVRRQTGQHSLGAVNSRG